MNRLLIYDKKIKQYKQEIVELEIAEKEVHDSAPFSKEQILEQLAKIESDRNELIEYKVREAQLRNKVNWYQYGEKMSKYFFQLEDRNFKRRNRYSIRTDDGRYISGPQEVLKEQAQFYQTLYGGAEKCEKNDFEHFMSNIEAPKLSDAQKDVLENEFTMEELKRVVFKSKLGKVCSSDGIPTEFYQKMFDEIKGLLLNVCRIVAKKGLHTTARQCIITLIEKVDRNLDYLKHWRPLSLLNCDGKFYAKILALRLDTVLPKLIHKDQTAFMANRNIHDNLMDLLTGIDYTNSSTEPYLLISFDFEKAFDNVSWEYIDYTLEYFNFGPVFRDMIQNALKGMVACTINNGKTSEYFSIEKGLRQGSPVSTGVFNLIVETLGLKIRQTESIEGIKYIGEVGEEQKKHVQYTDDLWSIIQGYTRKFRSIIESI